MYQKKLSNFSMLLIFYFFTALLRIASATLPFFPMGFSPMESLSLFSSRLTQRTWLVYLFPLLIIFSTDSIINFFFTRSFSPFYPGFYWQYISYLAIILCGFRLNRVILGSFMAATVFFIISNFGVWLSTSLYPFTSVGLITCYKMALPFYLKDILANIFFSSIIYFAFRSPAKSRAALTAG